MAANKSVGTSAKINHGLGYEGLKKLSLLLRNEGHKALNGGSSFTLTTDVLQQLNIECRRHSISVKNETSTKSDTESTSKSPAISNRRHSKQQNSSSTRTEWNYHMQFIKDFMEFTPNLKLVCSSGSLTCSVSLYRFGNLASLNLQKVPVHLIEGLHVLRSTLTSITVYKSVENVKDLLEFCGRDMSTAQTWSQLRVVSLMFNSITQLDDSLRLLPHVEAIDFSHNSLQTCETFLEYLENVRSISLAYNLLSQIPPVSLTTRSALTCLVMRGNNLDCLKGLEVLVTLQQLDLGENCVSKHSVLDCLVSLVNLRQLQMDGNPLFYHRLHRQLTASSLAPQAASIQFELDKKKLTSSEISYFWQVKAQFEKMAISRMYQRGVPVRRKSVGDRDDNMSPVSGPVTEQDSSTEMSSPKQKRRNRYKKLKARNTPIIDRDNSGDIYYSQEFRPGSAPPPRYLEKMWNDRREEALRTKREIEELRRVYGPNWLQAMEDRDIFNKKGTIPVRISSVSKAVESESENKERKVKLVIKSTASHESALKNMTRNGISEVNMPVTETVVNDVKVSAIETNTEISKTNVRAIEAATTVSEACTRDVGTDIGGVSETSARATEIYKGVSGLRIKDTESDKTFSKTNIQITEKDKGLSETNVRVSEDNKTDETHGSTQSSTSDTKNSVMSTIARLAAGISADEVSKDIENRCNAITTKISVIAGDNFSSLADNVTKNNINHENSVTARDNSQNLSNKRYQASDSTLVEKGSQNTSPKQQPVPERTSLLSVPGQASIKLDHGVLTLQKDKLTTVRSRDVRPASQKSINGYSTESRNEKSPGRQEHTRENFANLLEEDEVVEPMFVTCPLRDNQMIILSITASFLVEKDIRGQIGETLQLASLLNMEWKNVIQDTTDDEEVQASVSRLSIESEKNQHNGDNLSVEDRKMMVPRKDEENLQLDLKFDYVRKDKQNRRYLLDTADGQVLVAYLQPFLDSREELARIQSSISIQCLKCNQIFQKGCLLGQGQLAKSTSHRDLLNLQDPAAQDTQTCPKCGSSLMIELAPGSLTRAAVQSSMSPGKRLMGFMKRSSPAEKAADDHRTVQVHRSVKKLSKKASNSVLTASNASQGALPSLLGGAYESSTVENQKILSSLGGSRDRSSAFIVPANMSISSLTASVDQREDGGDILVCVEDHFSVDSMNDVMTSSQLAKVTTNLQRYFSGRDRRGSGGVPSFLGPSRKKSMKQNNTEHPNLSPSYFGPNQLLVNDPSKETNVEANYRRKLSDASMNKEDTQEGNLNISHSIHRSLEEVNDISNVIVSEDTSREQLGYSACSTRSNTKLVTVSHVDKSDQKDVAGSLYSNQTDPDSAMLISPVIISKDSSEFLTNGMLNIEPSNRSAGNLTSIYDHQNQIKTLPSKPIFSDNTPLLTASTSETSISVPRDGVISSHSTTDAIDATFDTNGTRFSRSESVTKTDHTVVPSANLAEDEDEMSDESTDMDDFDSYDFQHLNHRLTLHMMMSLFSPDEEFVCKIQCPIVQYIIEQPYDAIMVMSTLRFYVLKITSQDRSGSPDKWLQCVEIQPIPELHYIDVGLCGQTLRLEFVTDCSSFTLITQNRNKTAQFVDLLHTNLTNYAVRHCLSSHVIVNEDIDQVTINNLDQDVILKSNLDQKLLFYCMGYIVKGCDKPMPVSFAITTCDICLIRTNHQWPQARLQAPITVETAGKQFTVLDRQKLTNVASMQVCETSMRKIQLELFAEADGLSTSWKITLGTRFSTGDFIRAITEPWSKEFGVEMNVTYAELDF